MLHTLHSVLWSKWPLELSWPLAIGRISFFLQMRWKAFKGFWVEQWYGKICTLQGSMALAADLQRARVEIRRPHATEGEWRWWLAGRWQPRWGYGSAPNWALEEMELVLSETGKAAGRAGLVRMVQGSLLAMRNTPCLTNNKSSINGSYHYHPHHP